MRILRNVVSGLVVLAAGMSLPAQSAPLRAFTGMTLIDGTDRPAIRNGVVVVQDGRVVAAGAVTKLSGEIPKLEAANNASNGDALVKMCIDAAGKVTSVKVVKSTGAIANDLQTALTSWRYKPYTNKDRQTSAVCFPLQLRLVFKRAD
jgi:TonB family protein